MALHQLTDSERLGHSVPQNESTGVQSVVLMVTALPAFLADDFPGDDFPALVTEVTDRLVGAEHILDLSIRGASTVAITLGMSGPRAQLVADPALAPAFEADLSAAMRSAGHVGATVAIVSAGPPMSTSKRTDALWQEKLKQLQFEVVRLSEDCAFRREIAQILERDSLRTVFQPIVTARGGRTIGFEALSRGPSGHRWERPDLLLLAAERGGLSSLVQYEMARSARRRAAERLTSPDHLLFINAPDTRFWTEVKPDPEGSEGKLWPRNRVVSEVSERTPIANVPAVWEVRDRAREEGIRFALDDVGAGYAGLAALALLAPEYVKVDMSIIRGCDSDPAKQAVIAALTQYARRAGATVIAEGVETTHELQVSVDLGVELIQGFLIGTPVEFPSQ